MELANAWSASSVLFREARVSSRVRLAPIVEAIVRLASIVSDDLRSRPSR